MFYKASPCKIWAVMAVIVW